VSWPEPVHDRRHPPFAPGHELSIKHGAWSPRKYGPLTEQLVTGMLELAKGEPHRLGYLAAPEHAATLWAWARTEARVQLVYEWLHDQGGEVDDEGDVTAASTLLTRLERQAESLRARLGLDPRSAADLAKARAGAVLVGFDLQAAVAAGREVLDAHARETGEAGPSDAPSGGDADATRALPPEATTGDTAASKRTGERPVNSTTTEGEGT
jgi:hypothetical protein